MKRGFDGLKLLLMLGMLMSAGRVLAEAEVAVVLESIGEVSLMNSQGDVRRLLSRDTLAVGDTLITGEASFVELRFIDAGLLSLEPDSRFTIDAFTRTSGTGNEDLARFTLSSGGVKLVSGFNAGASLEGYQLYTAFAVVAGDGTFQCIKDSVLSCGVYNGRIELKNRRSSLKLGQGGVDFAEVSGMYSPIKALQEKPESLVDYQRVGRRGAGTERSASRLKPSGLEVLTVREKNTGPADQ